MAEIPTIPLHVPHSTIINLPLGEILWTSDFKADMGDKGEWSGSESFFCHLNETTQFLPQKGASCQFPSFSFLKVSGVSVENYEGDIVKVTVRFKGFDKTGEETDDDDPNDGEYTYDLSITTAEEPLAAHPKYSGPNSTVTKDDMLVIRNFISGKFAPHPTIDYAFKDINNHTQGKLEYVTTDDGKELVDFLAIGVEKYLAAYQTWRVTYVSDQMVPAAWLNRVGYISAALNAPVVEDNRDWLFIGCNVSQTGDIYTITLEWRLSGLGGWHSEIYTKPA